MKQTKYRSNIFSTAILERETKQFLVNEDINIVIQINGKKRSIINCKKGITEQSLMKIISDDIKLNKFFENKRYIESIFIKDKLINLIVK